MERINEMEIYIREYWEKRTIEKELYVFQQKNVLKKEIESKIHILIDEQLKNQSKNKQGALKYLYLCRLLSSVYTKSYEVILGLSNSQMYLDENRSDVYWYSSLIYDSVEEDFDNVIAQLHKHFVRLEAYELFYLKERLLFEDWKIFEKVYAEIGSYISEIIVNSSLVLDSVFVVLSGNYMETLQMVKRIEINV